MRHKVNSERVQAFMRALGHEAKQPAHVYLTGGATAVLLGWRDATVDIDLQIVPEDDHLFRALSALKEQLNINIELASPAHFIPELPGWEERSKFIAQEHLLAFYHYDLYAQALSKIERAYARDLQDVREMILRQLISPAKLRELFEVIFPFLYRFPAIHPSSFRRNLESFLESET
jgi:hypothetical protein